MENIQGLVEHIIYRNDDNGYTVMSIQSQGDDIVCVGTLSTLSEGEYIKAEGEFVDHPSYGEQFKISSYDLEMPEDIFSIERYLGSGAIRGVGPALAGRIVKKFKQETFRIIEEEPERLSEIKGISERKAREIYEQFHDKQDMRQAMMFLGKYGITTAYAVKIYNEYGSRLYDVIRENPYQLAEDITGIGFRLADEIARQAGIGQDSDFRIRSGIIYMLLQGTLSGHTYIPAELLKTKTAQMLEISPEHLDKHLMDLNIDKKVVLKTIGEELAVYAASYYYTELNTARMLLNLNIREDVDIPSLERMIARIEENENLQLDGLQRKGVMEAARNGVLVITGGPGTGKTTTINSIIKYFEYMGMDIRLAAPTGRAAKRMTEATGYEAQTIHRMLELSGMPDESAVAKFERNEQNPLETDVIIIDEMSMVDINLMHSLLKAVMVGTRLILVGDVNQLPSVGPGNVLKDIICSHCFNVVKLTKIFRQAMDSNIITNAHRINAGEPIVLDNLGKAG